MRTLAISGVVGDRRVPGYDGLFLEAGNSHPELISCHRSPITGSQVAIFINGFAARQLQMPLPFFLYQGCGYFKGV
jgi:hypothetical protein